MPDQHPIIAGAEPLNVAGGPVGVLVLHGFTGNPSSMRGLATAFVEAGHTVEMPRLPGHGTDVEDMLRTGWSDWSAAAEAALVDLQSRTDEVVVAGLSMGGSLTAWLATRHPELAGIICINPAVAPQDEMLSVVTAMVEAGDTVMAGIGSDVADPDVVEWLTPRRRSPRWCPCSKSLRRSWPTCPRSNARCCCSPAPRTTSCRRPTATCWPLRCRGRSSGSAASAATTWRRSTSTGR